MTSFQSGSASFTLQAKCEGSTYKLSSKSFTSLSNFNSHKEADQKSFTLITVPFSVSGIPLKFTLKAITGYFVDAILSINSECAIRLSGIVYCSLDGSLTFDALVISASLGINASRLLELGLLKIGNLRTNTVTGSSSATIGPVTIYASGHVAGVPWHVDICSTPYRTFQF